MSLEQSDRGLSEKENPGLRGNCFGSSPRLKLSNLEAEITGLSLAPDSLLPCTLVMFCFIGLTFDVNGLFPHLWNKIVHL